MKPADPQTERARLVVEALARAGVRELVLSPGSRSTSLLLAFLEHGGFRVHDFVDERVAAFFALGQARVSGEPSVLLCTSGSAPAHYFPAIVEAGVSHLPMVVLTADRPVELLGCGESQTIDQVKLFGEHVRCFVDLGAPTQSEASLDATMRHVTQAVSSALGPRPGAVHVNVRATRPLEPRAPRDEVETRLASRAAALRAGGRAYIDRPELRVSESALARLAAELASAERLAIVAGPASLAAAETRALVAALSDTFGAPIFAEATSQLRFGLGERVVGGFDAIFRAAQGRARFAPTLLLQLEGAPIAKGLSLLDAECSVPRVVLASHGHPDPTNRARTMLVGDVRDALERLLEGRASRVDAPYRGALLELDRDVSVLARASIDEAGDALVEGAVVHEVVRTLRDTGTLFVGNSLPVRELDTFTDPREPGPRVLSQRGASGIDGNLAGAAGAASKRAPLVALVGDVTFLHDLGGLAAVARAEGPLVVVVVNNGGGRIFEQLPIAERAEVMPYFTTPHTADLEAASKVFGLPHTRVSSRSALVAALTEGLSRAGGHVIEACVPPHDAAARHRALWAQVDRMLADRPG